MLFIALVMIDAYEMNYKAQLEYKKRLDDSIKTIAEKRGKIGTKIIVDDTLEVVGYDETNDLFLLSNGMLIKYIKGGK